MTREEAIAKLKEAQHGGDTEDDHYQADLIICALLSALGYDDVVTEYHKVDKWYA